MSKTLAVMAEEVAENNRAKGWYETERSVPEGLMLLVTEVSEAMEAWRTDGLIDITNVYHNAVQHGGSCGKCHRTVWLGDNECPAAKPEGYGSELADVLIRLLDQAHRDGIDLEAEYERKVKYNATRAYKHGNKAL